MDRRGFLGALFGAAVLDPERLLWVPGQKMISIPAPRMVTPDDALKAVNDLISLWAGEPLTFHPSAFLLQWPPLRPARIRIIGKDGAERVVPVRRAQYAARFPEKHRPL
jgi:hypothetical protein